MPHDYYFLIENVGGLQLYFLDEYKDCHTNNFTVPLTKVWVASIVIILSKEGQSI
jgi:hypothetical protein